jgi:chemotaxis response regulator CheB
VSQLVKILMVDVPSGLRNLLQDVIQRRENMLVVGEAFDPIDLLLAVNETDANVVIMGHPQADRMPGICTHLLAEFPILSFLIVSTTDQRAFLYERKITREEVSYTIPEDLIAKVNEAYPAIY